MEMSIVDKIGRVMDKLYQLNVSVIFLLISLAAVKKFGVATENSHLDSTSLSVEGEYKKEYPTVEILVLRYLVWFDRGA